MFFCLCWVGFDVDWYAIQIDRFGSNTCTQRWHQITPKRFIVYDWVDSSYSMYLIPLLSKSVWNWSPSVLWYPKRGWFYEDTTPPKLFVVFDVEHGLATCLGSFHLSLSITRWQEDYWSIVGSLMLWLDLEVCVIFQMPKIVPFLVNFLLNAST
jgi:hypothetical protein